MAINAFALIPADFGSRQSEMDRAPYLIRYRRWGAVSTIKPERDKHRSQGRSKAATFTRPLLVAA